MNSIHKTVLLKETIDGLNLRAGAKVLDGTFGGGGHSAEIMKRYPDAEILALDQDKGAWERAKEKFSGTKSRINFKNGNFREIHERNYYDGIIFDLGLSSDQLENSGRGFSFMKDEPLLMTMKENPDKMDITARDIVNSWSEENLGKILYGYGEEKYSRKIAKAIVENRKTKDVESTHELVEIIKKAVPAFYRRGRIHFATKTFQAIRIAANDELETLKMGLEKGFQATKEGGRIAVISFHSLEDRIVKNFYKEKTKEGLAKLITKKPITAGDEEIKNNPRSRSAKLRILEKIKD